MHASDQRTLVSAFSMVLVEDDRKTAELLMRYLAAHDVYVHHYARGLEAVRDALQRQPEVVVLDWMLPDISGVEVCGRLRERSDVPIVMLTAKDGEMDRVCGFDCGADDYVTKPFSAPELLARLRAHVRRARGLIRPTSGRLQVGPLVVEVEARSATLDGRRLELTTYEFDLLVVMASRAGRVLSREMLMELVTGDATQAFDRAIDVHVSNLRSKLGDNPRAPRLLRTVRGVGYCLSWSDP